MNYSYENQGSNTYLVYTIGENETVDTMSLGMLTNNKIHGLAPALYTQMDATRYIKYNISAKISVQQYFTGPINKRRLIGVFSGIANAIIAAEDYMIDINSMVFDLNYIFVDVSTNETELICLPTVEQSSQSFDVGSFFKNIVFSSQFDQTENCDYVTKIINFLNSSPAFSVYEFKKVLDEIADQNSVPQVQPVVSQPVAQQTVVQKPVQPVQQPVVQKPVQAVTPPVVQQPVAPTQPKVDNVAVPNIPSQPQPAIPQAQTKQETSEKKISMLELLMHYNKENAAAYKAQKESKKKAGNVPAPAKQPSGVPVPNAGFAVPGQPVPPPAPKANFAVPGQPTPPPAPKTNFAVPGQPTSPPAPPKKEQPKTPVVEQPQNKQPVTKPVVQETPVAVQTPTYQPPVNIPPVQNFGETTVLGGGANMGETTVLGASTATVQENPHLIRVKNNEKINLNKPVFRIGKEKSYVDYFIGDNTAISRSHANFITRDGEYFVTDTNSTNHTYVNGVMIQSNVETKLTHGDKVRLANEDFEFKLY